MNKKLLVGVLSAFTFSSLGAAAHAGEAAAEDTAKEKKETKKEKKAEKKAEKKDEKAGGEHACGEGGCGGEK